jgi:ABC-type nitrate/sulfonate/bicarbonate transport system substrate-binding protein
MKTSTFVMAATLAALSAASADAADLVKVAIGQRGLWDSAVVELGRDKGVFAKHGVTTEIVYTAGGGETQQAVISGSVDIGVSAGTLGVLSAFAKGAPMRIIAGEATGTAEYYFAKADSVVQKDSKGVMPTMTLAYSTAGSGTHITALRFMKEYGFQAQLVKTGTVPATFIQVMSGQVDIGFSTPPVALTQPRKARSASSRLPTTSPASAPRRCGLRSRMPTILLSGPRCTRALSKPTARRSIGCIPMMPRSMPSRNGPTSRRSWPEGCATASIRRRCCN